MLIIAISLVLGYVASVFWPMPMDWQDSVKAPFRPDGLVGSSVLGELLGTLEPISNNAGEVGPKDETPYATQQDLLINPADVDVIYTILLGEYEDQRSGNKHLEYIGMTDITAQYVPFKDPLGRTTLLLLLGEFDSEDAAKAQQKSWEAVYDVNLQIVKKPVLSVPETSNVQPESPQPKSQPGASDAD